MQWKDKCTLYSFTTKKLTHSMCQVSLVNKYILYHLLFYTTYISVDLAQHGLFRAKVGKSGIT